MKIKFTPWFPGKITPKRKGWYQRNFDAVYTGEDGGIWFSYWDGKNWSAAMEYVPENKLDIISPKQNLPWRGIAK